MSIVLEPEIMREAPAFLFSRDLPAAARIR